MKRQLYQCKRCGKPTSHFHAYPADLAKLINEPGFSYCDDCSRQLVNMRRWENEQFETEELVCPWCGYSDPDSWELADSDGNYECSSCGEIFEYERNIEVTYTSRRRREDYPGDGSES